MQKEGEDEGIVVYSQDLIYKGKYLNYYHYLFENRKNKSKGCWEVVKRDFPHPVYWAKLIPLVISKDAPKKVLLELQYRAPLNNFVIEFPAFLNESGDPVASALNGLKEETGYTGKIKEGSELSSYITLTDAWKSDDNAEIFVAEIDLDDKNNFEVGKCEGKKVELLVVDNLYEELQKKIEEKCCLIEGAVWMFALGMHFAKMVKH